jgi:futalosine hydrolase
MARLLVVTAVQAEADAVLGDLQAAPGLLSGLAVRRVLTPAGLLDVLVGGVGAVEAALSTAAVLGAGYEVVISAGVAGGFAPAEPADVLVARAVAFADLGAELADGGFASVTDLGFGQTLLPADPALAQLLAARTGARTGTILTVATVTGTRATADWLRAAYPDAVAEGMEGAGVAAAAQRAGVRFGELRTVSNRVGPRDRDGWQLRPALQALTTAMQAVLNGGPL